jgi:hypothetical protein
MQSGTLHAETAVEAIVRESANPLLKRAPAAAPVSASERQSQEKKSKEMISAEAIAELQLDVGPRYRQRIEEIIVEGQREPEDVTPPEKTPFQKMREGLDRVGPNLSTAKSYYTDTEGIVRACFWKNGVCVKSPSLVGQFTMGGVRGY